jgi:hypothetical protein
MVSHSRIDRGCRRLGGQHGRSERVRKISLPPGFDPRIVQPEPLAVPTELSGSVFFIELFQIISAKVRTAYREGEAGCGKVESVL